MTDETEQAEKPAPKTRAKPKPKPEHKAPEKQMNTAHPVEPKNSKKWRRL